MDFRLYLICVDLIFLRFFYDRLREINFHREFTASILKIKPAHQHDGKSQVTS